MCGCVVYPYLSFSFGRRLQNQSRPVNRRLGSSLVTDDVITYGCTGYTHKDGVVVCSDRTVRAQLPHAPTLSVLCLQRSYGHSKAACVTQEE